ncbi:TIGR04211 family SH3 domain-containing protein [Pelagibaculum spongiae]|nr:TIGR04211 family SH3 domain-containing protein [Pelagibaculum spongiae]
MPSIIRTFAVLFLFLSSIAQAETLYIIDQLWVPMRSGESTAYRIIRNMSSGSSLEVLSVNEETGYTKVKNSRGEEGFIASRFMSNKKIARHLLKPVTTELEKTKQRLTAVNADNTRLQAELQQLDADNKKLNEQVSQLQQNFSGLKSATSDVVGINQENEQMRTRLVQLEKQKQSLEQQTQMLENDSTTDQWLWGALIAFFGAMVTFVISRLMGRSKQHW